MKAALTMPTSGMSGQQFEIERNDFNAPEASGRVGGVQSGFPLWLAVYQIGTIGAAKSDELRAFFTRLRGQQRRFLGHDLARPYPKAHITGFAGMTRAGGGSFDGSATSWSETITADGDSEVTLHGMPAGLELTFGDYVGFKYDATEESVAGLPWRALVRVVEGGVADGSGNITVTSEPPVPLCVPPGAVAHLDQPACIMAMIKDKSSLEGIDRRLAVRGGTITALQDLRG